ncbi:MAG: PAS domain-containing protein, partial [Rhodobacterales bacterium]|nr:PAS domain-containing protein [Rhodobacterales bacterium]
RSVAHAINAIRRRAQAEAESRAATEALALERNRLALTLSALPDLLLELDRDGRFVDYHSGGVSISEQLVEQFNGYLLEDVLPPEMAALGRRILTDLVREGRAEPAVIQFDFGQGPRWLQAHAVLRGTGDGDGAEGFLMVLRDITREHEQAQEIARLSEVARRTTNLVFVTDAARRIVWVNAAFEALTGWTLAQARGQSPDALLLGARTDPAQVEIVRRALDQGRPIETEILARDRHNFDYWLHLDFQPLHDAEGRLSGFMAVGNDITVSKAQELALEAAVVEANAAQARLMAAVGALTDGFALYDADDRLVLCNDRYREIYPKSAAAMVPGARFEDILRHGLAQGEYTAAIGREEEWLRERMAAHFAPEHQMEQQLQDGRWLRIFERSTPDGGRVGLRVDITALKLAEERALADRAAAMDASMDAIAITDAGCRFLYANAAYGRITGVGDDLTGRDWRELFAPELVSELSRTALPQLRASGNWQGDVVGHLAGGAAVDVDISLTQRPDGAVLWIMRDLTERRRAESERARLREELHTAQRREVIGQLSAGLAHDFNNLLATIAGSASLIGLEAGPQSLRRVNEHARRIQRASQQAEGLVRRLLTLGARTAQIERIDLTVSLREAAELLRPSLPKTIRLALDLPATPVYAEADPTDVLQLLLNLALNARDAMLGHPAPPGGHVITMALAQDEGAAVDGMAAEARRVLQIGAAVEGVAHARIRITDTGPGLTAAAAERAFAPYFTSKGNKGSGLGLSIVQAIILSVNGMLLLSRGPEGGASFTLCWPLAAAQSPEALPAGASVTPGARLDGVSVLLVDDSEDVLSVMTGMLEQLGAEVAPSTNPAELLEVLAEAPDAFDAVVTDFDMPAMSGADLARAVHALRPDLPVVLVTALPDWEARDMRRATRPDFAAVLPKPASSATLVTTLRGIMKRIHE